MIREFEILGESTKYLIEANLLSNDNRVVVDFRNLLVHYYFGIDADEVWNVVKDDLPSFKKDIEFSINNIDKGLKIELKESFIEQNKYLDFLVVSLKEII